MGIMGSTHTSLTFNLIGTFNQADMFAVRQVFTFSYESIQFWMIKSIAAILEFISYLGEPRTNAQTSPVNNRLATHQ